MDLKTVIFVIIIIVLLYLVIRFFMKSSNTLTSTIMAGTTQQQVSASTIASKSNNGANSSNFTYSIWFYIDDWNYMYNMPKVLFGRMGGQSSSSSTGSIPGVSGTDPCPLVTFGAINNNLSVALTCAATNATVVENVSGASPNTVVHTCTVNNVPIQVWTNLLISVYGKTMDIYLDGKLVNTCLLPGIALVNTNADLYITPNGGFSGWTSKLQYYPNATDPQTAWNIYKQGYGGSMFSNYNVNVSFTENGNVVNSFTI